MMFHLLIDIRYSRIKNPEITTYINNDKKFFSWGLLLRINIVDMSNERPSHQALIFTNSFTPLFFNLSSFYTTLQKNYISIKNMKFDSQYQYKHGFQRYLILLFYHGGGGGGWAGGVGRCGKEEKGQYKQEGGGSRHGC